MEYILKWKSFRYIWLIIKLYLQKQSCLFIFTSFNVSIRELRSTYAAYICEMHIYVSEHYLTIITICEVN